MSKPIIIIIIFILLTTLITWQYFMPAFDKVSGLREELKTWQGRLGDAQALSKRLESLKIKYNTMLSEAERVSQAVPSGEDIPGLLVQLEQIASQNGLILNSMTFVAPEIKKAKMVTVNEEGVSSASSVPAGTKILTIDLSLTGAQSSFRAFLSAIEENLRIMDVAKISFTGKGSAGESSALSASQDFKISLNTYFKD